MGDNVDGLNTGFIASAQRPVKPATENVRATQTTPSAGEAIKDMGAAKALVQDRVAEVNAVLREMDRDFGLRMDDTLNRPVVTLVKQSTGEVVQQLPAEGFLKAAKNIHRLTGLLLQLKG